MYNVDRTVRGRFTVDKFEVSPQIMQDSRDVFSVDHPLAAAVVWSCSTGNTYQVYYESNISSVHMLSCQSLSIAVH